MSIPKNNTVSEEEKVEKKEIENKETENKEVEIEKEENTFTFTKESLSNLMEEKVTSALNKNEEKHLRIKYIESLGSGLNISKEQKDFFTEYVNDKDNQKSIDDKWAKYTKAHNIKEKTLDSGTGLTTGVDKWKIEEKTISTEAKKDIWDSMN